MIRPGRIPVPTVPKSNVSWRWVSPASVISNWHLTNCGLPLIAKDLVPRYNASGTEPIDEIDGNATRPWLPVPAKPSRHDATTEGGKTSVATEFAQDLDEQLLECKVALQEQAQTMLSLLLQFEAQLQARLDAAEARIAAARASIAEAREHNGATWSITA